MTIARKDIVREEVDCTYHCISRCVRRSFLCGFDKYSQKSFEHRKEWIRERIIFLSKAFFANILAYAILDNHLHLVINILWEKQKECSDEEILQKWNLIFPHKRDDDGKPVKLSPVDLELLLKDKVRIDLLRRRLSNISWFMRCLNEDIAKRANKEDNCKGRFWEGRFKCQVLLDPASILTCMVYSDLNPIRADIKEKPEESIYTSVYDRIVALNAKKRIENFKNLSKKEQNKITQKQKDEINKEHVNAQRDHWLLPLSKKERLKFNPVLNIDLEEYLALVDWTGRQIRKDKKGTIPSELAPILTRLEINNEEWLNSIKNYGRLFYRVVGHIDRIKEFTKNVKRCWFKGQVSSKNLFSFSIS